MKTLVIVIATLVLLAPALAGAQSPPSQAPPAPQAPAAPATPPAPAPAPGAPSSPAPESTTPQAQTPATPGSTAPRAPDAPAEGRIFGLSPLVAAIFGLIVLGVIIALVASRRRDHDVVVETRVDTPLPPERPLGMPESDIDRERRRRAS